MNLAKILRKLVTKGTSLSHVAMSSAPPPVKKARLENEEQDRKQEEEVMCPAEGELSESEDSLAALSEQEVGITEYLSTGRGFFGILKRRYCDFVVHEVAEDGGVVKLTNYSLPIEVNESEMDESDLEKLFGVETLSDIKQLVERGKTDDVVSFKAPPDKEVRGKMHRGLRALYPTLESETVEVERQKDGEACQPHPKNIVLRYASARRSGRTWPRDRGSYCKFVLYKEDKSTMDAVMILCRLLKVKPSCFSYAGVKDKRAISSQRVAAFKVSAERLQALNKRLMNIALGNFEYISGGIMLGALAGNHFSIVLRNVSCDDHVISEGVDALATNGFINYFGMQRFGTTTIPTYHIGRCLLHSDWQGAIKLVLKSNKGDKEDVKKAKEYYWNNGEDASGTLALMPKARYIERSLLSGLKKRKPVNDYYGAFSFIPRGNRMMYLHSWQSWCWNRLVSWRLTHLGLNPVPGDLVVKDNGEVSCITEDNVTNYVLTDVVLPLPGHSIELPSNEVKNEYERILTEEGVGVEQLKRSIKNLDLPGSYRPIVVKPTSVQWHMHYYDDFKAPLVLTDLDVLAAKQLPSSDDGSCKAVRLDFTLPSSCYATMAVRELTKMETSSAYQSGLGE